MNREQYRKLRQKLAKSTPRSELRAFSGAEHDPAPSQHRDSEDSRCTECCDLGLHEQQERVPAG